MKVKDLIDILKCYDSNTIVDGELHVKSAKDIGNIMSFYEVVVDTIAFQTDLTLAKDGIWSQSHVNCEHIQSSVKERLNAGWKLDSTIPGDKVTHLVYSKGAREATILTKDLV